MVALLELRDEFAVWGGLLGHDTTDCARFGKRILLKQKSCSGVVSDVWPFVGAYFSYCSTSIYALHPGTADSPYPKPVNKEAWSALPRDRNSPHALSFPDRFLRPVQCRRVQGRGSTAIHPNPGGSGTQPSERGCRPATPEADGSDRSERLRKKLPRLRHTVCGRTASLCGKPQRIRETVCGPARKTGCGSDRQPDPRHRRGTACRLTQQPLHGGHGDRGARSPQTDVGPIGANIQSGFRSGSDEGHRHRRGECRLCGAGRRTVHGVRSGHPAERQDPAGSVGGLAAAGVCAIARGRRADDHFRPSGSFRKRGEHPVLHRGIAPDHRSTGPPRCQ